MKKVRHPVISRFTRPEFESQLEENFLAKKSNRHLNRCRRLDLNPATLNRHSEDGCGNEALVFSETFRLQIKATNYLLSRSYFYKTIGFLIGSVTQLMLKDSV